MSEILNGDTSPKGEEYKPEPAESFLAEFNALKLQEVITVMSKLGFGFRRSQPDTESGAMVSFEGERKNDGTKITITFEKGQDYKSPKELADEGKV